jgi:hypothetical protein
MLKVTRTTTLLVVLSLVAVVTTTGIANQQVQTARANPNSNTPHQQIQSTDCVVMDIQDRSLASAWIKGYNDAHADFSGMHGHGYDPSTSLKGSSAAAYGRGYNLGWSDAQKGVYEQTC